MSIYPRQIYNKRVFTRGRYHCYMANGSKGSGKSTWLEFAGEIRLKQGDIVLDLWGAGNYENCFWCVPGKADPDRRNDPRARKVGYPVLIIHPKTMIIKPVDDLPLCTCGRKAPDHVFPWPCKRFVPLIMTTTDDTTLAKIVQMVLEEKRKYKRVIIFNEAFYNDPRDAYRALAKLLREFPMLIKRGNIPDNVSTTMIFRELGDLVTGGVKAIAGPYQTEVRRQMQTLARKCRHWKTNLLFDAQRNDDIAAAVADQKDYLIIKKATDDLIPEKYGWVIKKIQEKSLAAYADLDFGDMKKWPAINQLQQWQAYIVHPDNSIDLRTFPMPGFMHKREKDSWKKLANVVLEYDITASPILSVEMKAEQAQKAVAKKTEKITALKQAIGYHDKENMTWQDCAIKVGWLNGDGKPDGTKLQVDVGRYKKKGWLD